MNDSQTTTGVLLMAYGSVDDLDDLGAYLSDIRGGRPTSPQLLAEIQGRYERIGGSPLNRITMAQGEALWAELQRRGLNWPVYVGMRHWEPRIADVVAQIAANGISEIRALVLAPHYSSLSVGRYEKILAAAAEAQGLRYHLVQSWWQTPALSEWRTALIQDALADFGDADPQVVFTAHSLPTRIRREKDPYERELHQDAQNLATRAGLAEGRWEVAWQSAGASPEPWLEPALEDRLVELGKQGCEAVLVAPIGFVCDHVEVLYDIDIEARELAAAHGIELRRIPSPNTAPPFVAALADILTRET